MNETCGEPVTGFAIYKKILDLSLNISSSKANFQRQPYIVQLYFKRRV